MNAEGVLVQLFGEAVALARDTTLDDAERGRRLVKLLALPDDTYKRIRLTHLYGTRLAEDIITTHDELAPWRKARDAARAAAAATKAKNHPTTRPSERLSPALAHGPRKP